MALRQIFILNLKKFRKTEGISQMKLAEQCGTSPSYIGEIEIGRKFPSVEMIDKIAKALQLEPYRLFVDTADSGKDKPVEITDFLNDLPDDIKKELFNRLISGINDSIARILTPNQGGPESN
ncbi:MAG: helix-turn-helix transcriptional regulator [Treponema sp.]|jgi:transcriptional regulator with XRE-family HTH domain|nr:helix-turn-helix transcriptional regulator [Treponema sp.]